MVSLRLVCSGLGGGGGGGAVSGIGAKGWRSLTRTLDLTGDPGTRCAVLVVLSFVKFGVDSLGPLIDVSGAGGASYMYRLFVLARGEVEVRFGASLGNAFVSFTPSAASHCVAESNTSDASRLETLFPPPLDRVPASHIAADVRTVLLAAGAFSLSPTLFGDESIISRSPLYNAKPFPFSTSNEIATGLPRMFPIPSSDQASTCQCNTSCDVLFLSNQISDLEVGVAFFRRVKLF